METELTVTDKRSKERPLPFIEHVTKYGGERTLGISCTVFTQKKDNTKCKADL